MKKNDTLALNVLKPKKETIDFLLNYSKNIQQVRTKSQKTILVTNN